MSPPIQKDWWLAAALTGAALPAAMGQVPTAAESRPTAGIVTSVSQGAPATDSSTPIYIDNASGQRLTTGPGQTMHVLFSDQSALTIGPNSSLVIAEYRYDPATRDGALVVDLNAGVVRVVGGFISKQNETVVRAPGAGSFGIRGGITVVERRGGTAASGTFLFGQSMRVTDEGGQTQTVTRQGFGIDITGQEMSSPERRSSQDLTNVLNQLETRPSGGQQAGGQQPSGAPPGQLMSTGDRGAGGGSPGDSLANDRLKNANDVKDASVKQATSQNTRDVLGSNPTPNQS